MIFFKLTNPSRCLTIAVHHDTNQLLWMWKLHSEKPLFHAMPAQKWWKAAKDLMRPPKKVERSSPPKRGNKVWRAWLSWKERGQRGVSGRSGMLRGDKVPARSPDGGACHPHPEAGFISWTQQERRLGFVPQKPVSLTGFTACCYMPLPICATVWKFSLSHTLYLRLSVPIQFFFTAGFLLLLSIFLTQTGASEVNEDEPRYSPSPDWVLFTYLLDRLSGRSSSEVLS